MKQSDLDNLLGAHVNWMRTPAAGTQGTLAGEDLRGLSMRGRQMRRMALDNAQADGLDLTGSYLDHCSFKGLQAGPGKITRFTGCQVLTCDFSGADLTGTDWSGAVIQSPVLTGAKINWQSHELVAQGILLPAAGDDIDRLRFTGLVLICAQKCWDWYTSLQSEPALEWALDTMSTYVHPGDNAPPCIVGQKQ